MAKKTTAKAVATSKPDLNTLWVPVKDGEAPERQLADAALSPVLGNANTARVYMQGTLGDIDLTESVRAMRDRAKKVQAGDLSEVDTTLTAQAVALDAIFTELARCAALNMGQHMPAIETYMRLALKAQAQCRATQLGMRTYFCDPHSPWQKGGIENAIGRLRRSLPRKTDLATIDARRLDDLILDYNLTPRRCLAFRTPLEVFLGKEFSLGVALEM